MNRFGTARVAGGLLALIVALAARAQQPPEVRALWADAFGAGFKTAAEVTTLMDNLRAGNFNTIIPEVRKRGDAYYNSLFEPKATDISSSFDPLADMIAKAHDTSGGKQRLDVHAWIVSFKIWSNQSTPPSQTNHPYNLHPDWLTQNNSGATWDGTSYSFDPAHPDVQRHTFDVCMDIISRYDVDGLNFDYIRYTGNTWGYHPIAVSRFNARYGRTGTPAPTDPDWMQFRRDQVTAVVRKVYLHAIALKPHITISADTITWGNSGVTSDAQWYSSSSAYTDVLQDWRGWMQEGILDLNIPMVYYRHHYTIAPTNHALAYTNWMNFAKDRKFNRYLVVGPGIYLNYASNGIIQMRATRAPSPAGNFAEGVCGYVYKQPDNSGTPIATFRNYLTSAPNAHDPSAQAIFYDKAAIPVMPWKTAPTNGHLKGNVYGGSTTNPLDGAVIRLTGPTGRTQTNDATGFYGFVDLPPGTYTVTASFSNLASQSAQVLVTTGVVATLDFTLVPTNNAFLNLRVFPGETEALVAWNTTNASDSQVEWGPTAALGNSSWRDGALVTNHTVLLTGLLPNTNYFFRAVSRTAGATNVSEVGTFATAGEIVIDNTGAAFTGVWSTATASGDKFGADYHYATVNATLATATYTPTLATPGFYDVYVWYPQGGNRTTNAPWLVAFNGGTVTGAVNQTSGGGGWRLVAAAKSFARGTSGSFRWSNLAADAGKVVMADGVRFVYAAGQEPPAPGEVPRWWTEFFFGASVDAALDHDGDGFSTAEEYLAGTDPTRAGSRLAFSIESWAGNTLRLVFVPRHPGRRYVLEERDAIGAGDWTTASAGAGTTPAGDGLFAITNLNGTQKFYRLRAEL